jgi:Lrp/AsnC family transcriptional regulator, leucine-responsive regulatory protein
MESVALDAIDRRIIGELQSDARMSWHDLGSRIHLSPSAASERVRRLERTGVIERYAAVIDPAALGRPLRAVIDVSIPPGVEPAEFERHLAGRDEIVMAVFVTGAADYEIVVDCAGPDGLDRFIRWLKTDAGAARTESKVVLRRVVG